MTPDVIGWIAGGLIALAASAISVIASQRATRSKAKLDEVSAYSQLVEDLRTEIVRLRAEMDGMRNELDRSHSDNAGLRRQLAAMKRAVDHMAELLAQHNIPLPQET